MRIPDTEGDCPFWTESSKASSNPGSDVVLDPFCGSGTTLVAAPELDGRWIGIDANPDAVALAEGRMS